eukprot:gene9987-13438_t
MSSSRSNSNLRLSYGSNNNPSVAQTNGHSHAQNQLQSSLTRSPSKIIRQERQTNFKVVIRVRPPLPREMQGEIPFQNIVAIDEREQMITVSENLDAVLDQDGQVIANPGPYVTHTFIFDYVYDQNSTQKKVYETTARTVVDSALQGYNATIFAYGQTGTGKTFTMEGFNREGSIEARGIIPRAIEQIFGHIQRFASPRMRFLVRASYLQIYNEQISDLLKPERNNLVIREDKKRGVFVDGLSEWVVRSPAEIYGLMERGGAVRATGETKMNEASSRSHAVFIVIAEQSETVYVDDNGVEMSPEEFQKFMHGRGVRREQEMSRLEDHVRQSFKVGKLNLVDLAGSERVRLSGATGQRLEESKQINLSLSALGNVISALTDAKSRQHIPYRNSKLTRMLEDSLGGNCKTTMMAMISPAFEAMQETISTLKFANRAKNIRNEAKVNEDLDQKSLLRKYERELKKLRAELEERNKNVVDKRRLLELDEQRKRAEADKMAAIRALEARSLEFMKEKEEKKKLEQRIAMLMGQMIRGERSPGGVQGTDMISLKDNISGEIVVPELQVMMKQQQEKLREEYEFKLADLERERETIEEEKAQVDRYKQLLLKQRDIMIALTQRLVERDEQIVALQDELDAYDRHHKELEEKLDEKTAMLIKFKRISMEVNATSPHKSEELSNALVESSWTRQGGDKKFASGATELVYDDDTSDVRDMDDKIRGLNLIVSNQRAQIVSLENQLANNNNNNQTNSLKSDVMSSIPSVEKMIQSELDIALMKIKMDPQQRMKGSEEPLLSFTNQLINKLKDNNTKFGNGNNSDNSNADGHLMEENHQLKTEINRLKALNRQLEQKSRGSTDDNSTVLQARCDTLVKEREAVQTIMEHKIKVLVQSVAQAANTVISTIPPNAPNTTATQSLIKDVASLQRLVNASIAALRNAAAATSSNSSTIGSTPSTTSISNSQTISTNQSQMNSLPMKSDSSSLSSYFTPSNGDNGNIRLNNNNNIARTHSGNNLHRAAPEIPNSNMNNNLINYNNNNADQSNVSYSNGWGNKDSYYTAGDVYRNIG